MAWVLYLQGAKKTVTFDNNMGKVAKSPVIDFDFDFFFYFGFDFIL
jgi:hypothetical protein